MIRKYQHIYNSSHKERNTQLLRDQFWGPFLSLLYISDLPLNIQEAKLAICVDNINIVIIDKNIEAIEESLNRVMAQFETYFSNNSLIITTDKTKAMLFHFNETCNLVTPKIVFNNLEINYISGVKLRVNISNNLKWNNYFQSLCPKLKKVFCMITSLIAEQLIYVKKYIFSKISISNKVWYNFTGRGN
jgi:hypothetical protein